MVRTLYILILSTLVFSYKYEITKHKESESFIEIAESHEIKRRTKLDSLLLLPRGSVIEYLDLSNDSIKIFPDLSNYTIKILDMSFNQLDTLITAYLPHKLEKLIMSHNRLKGVLDLEQNSAPCLKEIDVSFNYIRMLSVSEPLYKIIVSHNDLYRIDLNEGNLRYIDFSFNPRFSNRVNLNFAELDTIVREGISNDRPLYNPWRPPGGLTFYNRIIPTALEYGLKQINAGTGLPSLSYLEETQNYHPFCAIVNKKDSIQIIEQSGRKAKSIISKASKTFFGSVNSIIRHKNEDIEVFVVIIPREENSSCQYKNVRLDRASIDTLNEVLFDKIKSDFNYGIKSGRVSNAEAYDLSLMVTHYSKEKAKEMFNADLMVAYPFNLEGKIYKKKYTVCRAVAVCRDESCFFMYFMLTKDNYKYFDSYLWDFAKVFWFRDKKRTGF